METPKRKQNRLQGYDYTQTGAYFITICVQNKRPILWDAVGENCVRPNEVVPLSQTGKAVEDEIAKIGDVYDFVIIDKYCIMPNHVHMILRLSSGEGGRTQFAPTVSRVVKQFKGAVTKKLGETVWQKSFYDHVIRDEQDYFARWKYIDENPVKWLEDELYGQIIPHGKGL